MKNIKEKIRVWWYFHVKNPVVRKGESKDGAFKWEFRRFWLDISTLSGNFKARYTADEFPYAYLLSGKKDDNIIGFCQIIYMLSKTIVADQGLANDVQRALQKYEKRMGKQAEDAGKKEDDAEEMVALENEKRVQEIAEMPKSERKKVERDINGRFKRAKAQSL